MKAKAYLVVHPTFSRRYNYTGPFQGERAIDKATITKVYAKKPAQSSLSPGDVVIEVEVDIDEAMFYPRRPMPVTIEVPAVVEEDPDPIVAPVTKVRKPSAAAKVIQ